MVLTSIGVIFTLGVTILVVWRLAISAIFDGIWMVDACIRIKIQLCVCIKVTCITFQT